MTSELINRLKTALIAVMEYDLKTLNSGLKVLEIPVDSAKSVTVLVLFGVGSRYETDKISGLSHFLEHMYFKGSQKRPTAMQISETIDAVGGEMNAFTGKEYTGYYIKVAGEHGELAMDVLSDMLQNPILDPEEIKRETGVIIEELKMYEDQPILYVGELFEEFMFGKTNIGRMTIGTRDTVAGLKRDDFVNYRKQFYTVNNTLVVLAGDLSKVKGKSETYFQPSNFDKAPQYLKQNIEKPAKKYLMNVKTTEQTHLYVGFKTIASDDPDRYILKVIASILGGGMSSRLFTQVRERRGLAYYVKTSSELYLDCGYLAARAGVAHEKFDEAMSAILEEFRKIRDEKVSEAELNKAKEYLKGSMWLSLETPDNIAEMLGLEYILHQEVTTPEERIKKIETVTAEDILRVAKKWFVDDRLAATVISGKDHSQWMDGNLSL